MQASINVSSRRYDLDWLRIGALALLIVTHSTYIYASWNWRVHSEQGGVWGDLIVEFLGPWRMSLIFFIAGAATRFMLEKKDFGAFVRDRALRLVVPFFVGAIMLVPIIQYIADPRARENDYLYYLTHDALNVVDVYGVKMPDFIHVWFLPYVFVYCLLAGLAWRFARSKVDRAGSILASAPIVVIAGGTAMIFIIVDAVLTPIFGRTNMLVNDPVGHLRSILPFLLGLLLVRPANFWTRLQAARVWLLPLAVVLMIAALGIVVIEKGTVNISALRWQLGVVEGAYGAVMLFAILAFASLMLNRNDSRLPYLGDAIMPVYLLHEPVLIPVAKLIAWAGLPIWLEYPLLLAAVGAISLLIYHVAIRPFTPMRVLFGLKPKIPKISESAPAALGRTAS